MNIFNAIVGFFIGIASLFHSSAAPIVASVTPADDASATPVVTIYVPQDATDAETQTSVQAVQSVEPTATVAVSKSLPIISQAEIDAIENIATTTIPMQALGATGDTWQSAPTTTPQPIVIFLPVPTPQNTEPLSNQNNIGNINTMPQISQAKITVDQSYDAGRDPVNGIPFGQYTFRVQVLDDNGVPTCGTFCENPRDPNAVKIPVTMSVDGDTDPASGNFDSRFINAKDGADSTNYYTSFGYVPTEAGDHTVVFTSGTFTKEVDINVAQ